MFRKENGNISKTINDAVEIANGSYILFLDNDDEDKLKEIWSSKWLTNCGPQHNLLEEMLKNKLEVPCLSLFNNGTIALMIACQSLHLTGEVITTPFTLRLRLMF